MRCNLVLTNLMILMSCWRSGGMSTWGVMPVSVMFECQDSRPIRGQQSGHVSCPDQSEASMWGCDPSNVLVIAPVSPRPPTSSQGSKVSKVLYIMKFLSLSLKPLIAQNGTRIADISGEFQGASSFQGALHFWVSLSTPLIAQNGQSLAKAATDLDERTIDHASIPVSLGFLKDQKRPDNH